MGPSRLPHWLVSDALHQAMSTIPAISAHVLKLIASDLGISRFEVSRLLLEIAHTYLICLTDRLIVIVVARTRVPHLVVPSTSATSRPGQTGSTLSTAHREIGSAQ